MPWRDEEFTRPRHELLATTRRRGEQLRQRRRLAYGLAAPALLLVVAIPAALALNGDGGKPTTVAASGGGTVTTTSTTTVAPVTTTEAPPTTGAAASPTTVGVGQTSTTLRSTTTTTASDPSATTTTTPDIGPCDRSKFTLTRPATSQARYRPGEEIVARTTLAFNATKPCGSTVSTRSLKVFDAAGTEVFGTAVIVDYITQPIHAPEETEVIDHRWPQVSFRTNAQALPGTYTLVISADEITSPPATVQLVAG